MTMAERKSTHVVMTSSTHDMPNGAVVAVTSDEAERLIANSLAREPRPGEVKAAQADTPAK